MSPTETKERGAEVELFAGYGDDNPNAVVAPDHNRDPQDVVTAAIDNNADIGVVIDMNGTKADHRGDNLEENERAHGILDATQGCDPEADWIGDRLGSDATNLTRSVYLSPPLDFKDPPDLEQSEPPPDPVVVPAPETGLLRATSEEQ